MPIQRTLFGRPFNIYILPRRFILLFTLLAALLLLSTTRLRTTPALTSVTSHLPTAPLALTPWRAPIHRPPPQANSSAGDARWHADWRWRNPFSSSLTLDENRAVLPPLPPRAPVYTFYTPNPRDEPAVRKAEAKLILQWRRAWWASGFRPIVLGRAEAGTHALVHKITALRLEDNMEEELHRWAAWGAMGAGILADWRVFPMGPPTDALLEFWRRGTYPRLTRYEGLGGGIYVGDSKAVDAALGAAIEQAAAKPEALKAALNLADPAFKELFAIDARPGAVAYYDAKTVSKLYAPVADALFAADAARKAHGYAQLSALINAHLHGAWQAAFPGGISIPTPLAKHLGVLAVPALEIAHNLTACPPSPIPTSCPPNRPGCPACLASHPLVIATPPAFRNKTGVFTIAPVPHPYTTTALTSGRDMLDVRFIRRLGMGKRNAWLAAITGEVLGTGPSASSRLVLFKEMVAGAYARRATLWLTAETELHEDLDWVFGFQIPANATGRGESETPVPGPERRPKKEEQGVRVEAGMEERLVRARVAVKKVIVMLLAFGLGISDRCERLI
ncbi:hypothetical protein EJ06DRAFT_548976 [Trichodelitschia bisporula]|uniref:Uncharacterized protein n=1 Tax=Trichodelitschia bisporula TaxID=703511 RepID=A0A6G1HWN4_9PEZI|nr:hypothetical protein EJ06DRAFT_548976 [Trichodelitschia bisporula]